MKKNNDNIEDEVINEVYFLLHPSFMPIEHIIGILKHFSFKKK